MSVDVYISSGTLLLLPMGEIEKGISAEEDGVLVENGGRETGLVEAEGLTSPSAKLELVVSPVKEG